ncbi:hypothetical protein CDD80_1385 [Ophiocordyceps camponoti-rufipedis]|uniref:Uncharacterized protein n=1 Tax=Ophiocordyceps camponoti-rufipedis TaxID=2004952 RepID=A0A2C5XM51_9HYPO|nr:hypothetical protein CDD80_1385 [Ophiocordyceps camponoti-rufipedis]
MNNRLSGAHWPLSSCRIERRRAEGQIIYLAMNLTSDEEDDNHDFKLPDTESPQLDIWTSIRSERTRLNGNPLQISEARDVESFIVLFNRLASSRVSSKRIKPEEPRHRRQLLDFLRPSFPKAFDDMLKPDRSRHQRVKARHLHERDQLRMSLVRGARTTEMSLKRRDQLIQPAMVLAPMRDVYSAVDGSRADASPVNPIGNGSRGNARGDHPVNFFENDVSTVQQSVSTGDTDQETTTTTSKPTMCLRVRGLHVCWDHAINSINASDNGSRTDASGPSNLSGNGPRADASGPSNLSGNGPRADASGPSNLSGADASGSEGEFTEAILRQLDISKRRYIGNLPFQHDEMVLARDARTTDDETWTRREWVSGWAKLRTERRLSKQASCYRLTSDHTSTTTQFYLSFSPFGVFLSLTSGSNSTMRLKLCWSFRWTPDDLNSSSRIQQTYSEPRVARVVMHRRLKPLQIFDVSMNRHLTAATIQCRSDEIYQLTSGEGMTGCLLARGENGTASIFSSCNLHRPENELQTQKLALQNSNILRQPHRFSQHDGMLPRASSHPSTPIIINLRTKTLRSVSSPCSGLITAIIRSQNNSTNPPQLNRFSQQLLRDSQDKVLDGPQDENNTPRLNSVFALNAKVNGLRSSFNADYMYTNRYEEQVNEQLPPFNADYTLKSLWRSRCRDVSLRSAGTQSLNIKSSSTSRQKPRIFKNDKVSTATISFHFSTQRILQTLLRQNRFSHRPRRDSGRAKGAFLFPPQSGSWLTSAYKELLHPGFSSA